MAQRKKEVRQAVLDEQKYQREHGYYDRFIIALVQVAIVHWV